MFARNMAEGGLQSQRMCPIRTAFKNEASNLRHRNVAKLLFIHMLGYPSALKWVFEIIGTSFQETNWLLG